MLRKALSERIRKTKSLKGRGLKGWEEAVSHTQAITMAASMKRCADAASLKVLRHTLLPVVAEHTFAEDTPKPQPRSLGQHSKQPLTGKDLVLICRQNSLLPVVLGLVNSFPAKAES